jgi:hypothetical protein
VSAHYSDDELTLYYYGEGRGHARVERHLAACESCAALYRDISRTLALVAEPVVPERGEQYGLEVWQRIRHQLPEPREAGFAGFARLADLFRWDRLAVAAAVAVLTIAAFIAGRSSNQPATQPAATNARASNAPAPPASSGAAGAAAADETRQRILLTSVADHLDRSERVLTDIMNAPGAGDISAEQRWAEDLLTTSRLYRQDAIEAGEQSVATVLDDLERNLLEIVHSPSKIGAADLEQIRRRIDAAALLFKVRVMSDELRRREAASAERVTPRTPSTTSSPSKVS